MYKRVLYLDIDDVVKDTNRTWREALGYQDYSCCIYEKELSRDDKCIVMKVMSDYSKIPFVEGAECGISELSKKYSIVLCSNYYSAEEFREKKKLADSLGLGFIGCGPNDRKFKSGVNMSGAVFVDDSIRNLVHSNASLKILFICEDTVKSEYSYDGLRVEDWESLIKLLMQD